MKQQQFDFARKIIKQMYSKYPKAFDTRDDKELFKLYCTKWLGLTWNPLAELRYKGIGYPTFERAKRKEVSEGHILISHPNLKARHIEATQTKEVIKPKTRRVEFIGNTAVVFYE